MKTSSPLRRCTANSTHPVQKFIEKHPLAKTQFKMSFETKIIERRFADEFLSKDSAIARARLMVLRMEENEFSTSCVKAILTWRKCEFLRKVWDALHRDLRSEQKVPMQVLDQLAKGVTVQQLYEHLFGFSYLTPFFTLRWAGKDVQQLSR